LASLRYFFGTTGAMVAFGTNIPWRAKKMSRHA